MSFCFTNVYFLLVSGALFGRHPQTLTYNKLFSLATTTSSFQNKILDITNLNLKDYNELYTVLVQG